MVTLSGVFETRGLPLSNYQRWTTYFSERFPVLQNGLIIAFFSLGTLSYLSRLQGEDTLPESFPFIASCISVFLFFLQLRIFDEFKDFEEDSRWRPYRPVPRGLVSLRELGWLWVVSAAIQLGIALFVSSQLVLLLLVIWAYSWLMRVEFFVSSWLKQRPLAYMASHILIVPLITFYVAACSKDVPALSALGWLLLMSYFSFFIVEIGRKIRAPAEEETGVDTYSKLWGINHALMAWLGAMLLTSASAVAAAFRVGTALPTVIGCGLLWLIALGVSLRFLHRPGAGQSKTLPILSGIWIIAAYLLVGTGLAFSL